MPAIPHLPNYNLILRILKILFLKITVDTIRHTSPDQAGDFQPRRRNLQSSRFSHHRFCSKLFYSLKKLTKRDLKSMPPLLLTFLLLHFGRSLGLCPTGFDWEYVPGGTCYSLTASMSWPTAQNTNTCKGGWLVNLPSDEERAFLRNYLASNSSYWIGGYLRKNDQYFDWLPPGTQITCTLHACNCSRVGRFNICCKISFGITLIEKISNRSAKDQRQKSRVSEAEREDRRGERL
jgi:hypothetical protein